MARVESWLIKTLLADGDVTALLANSREVHPVYLPQGDGRPAIVTRREKTDREYTNQGNSGMAITRFSVVCMAADFGVVEQLAEAARLAIEYGGAQQPDQPDFKIQAASIEDEYDEEDLPLAAEGRPMFGVRLEVAIHHTETTRPSL